LKGHSTSVNCFGVFPDQPDRLASGSYDTHIKLWDVRDKNNTATLKGHTKQINSIDISPDEKMLLSGGEDNQTKIWDLRYPEKLLASYTDHNGPITKVRFNPEDRTFASCSMDKTAKYSRC
jgi:WD40 repeat protein